MASLPSKANEVNSETKASDWLEQETPRDSPGNSQAMTRLWSREWCLIIIISLENHMSLNYGVKHQHYAKNL